jgi:hypothetical protein
VTTAIGTYATAALLKARTGISDTTDDTLLGTICDQVNQYIETRTRRVLAPVGSATYLLDGTGCEYFEFPRGIRAISALSIGDVTGGTRIALASTEYFLRPLEHDRLPGWPAMRVVLSDVGTRRSIPRGFEIISMTATTGWAAIPDDVTEMSLVAATKAWHAREAGQADIVGTDEMGRPLVSRFFSPRDMETLRTYSLDTP